MRTTGTLVILVVIVFLIYTQPNTLVNFSHTLLGKVFLLIITVLAAQQSTVFGLLMALILVTFLEYNYEGFENGTNSEDDGSLTSKDKLATSQVYTSFKNKEEYLKQHCKIDEKTNTRSFTDVNGIVLTPRQIKKKYPNISFTNKPCNPCSEECSYELTDSSEQFTVQENLRPKDSSTLPT